MSIKLLLVDDHTLFRVGLEGLLTSRDIEVIASIGDGKEALNLVQQLNPDIVLLDLRMPNLNGIEILRNLRNNDVSIPIVMLTTSSESEDLINALKSGAQGYLLKDMDPDDLVLALKDISQGKTVVAPELAHVLARALQGESESDEVIKDETSPFSDLTPRESEILGLLAEGQSNKAIARTLGISDGTVKLHVKAILRKLEVHSRVEAAVMAVEHGLSRKKEQDN